MLILALLLGVCLHAHSMVHWMYSKFVLHLIAYFFSLFLSAWPNDWRVAYTTCGRLSQTVRPK
jgi:hypothetical protein